MAIQDSPGFSKNWHYGGNENTNMSPEKQVNVKLTKTPTPGQARGQLTSESEEKYFVNLQ